MHIRHLYILIIYLFSLGVYSQEPAPSTGEDMNWISSIGYNLDGQTISKGVSYYNVLGKPTQSQSWDLLTGKVWNSEVKYDHQGRPAFQTLSAPKGTSFGYQSNFVRTTSGGVYGDTNYDSSTTIENPSAVGTQSNSLGYYYSTDNTGNPYQDITNYPFSRTVYSKLRPGAVKKVLGGNKVAGEWKQTYSFSMVAGQELSQSIAFGGPGYNDDRITKTVSRDVHGVESVVFTNSDGHTLAVARSGNESSTPAIHNNTVSIEEQGWVDIHIGTGCNGVLTLNNPEAIELTVYDLITEEILVYTTDYLSLNAGFYRIAVRYPENYVYNSSQPISLTHKVNYYDYALNYYDKAGRLLRSRQPNGTNPSDVTVGVFQSTFKYNSLGQLLETTSPDEGTAHFKYRKDGQIRFSQNSKQASNNEFSYTNYDTLGRPVESGVYSEVSNAADYLLTFEDSDSLLDQPDGLDDANCSEQHFTKYDVADEDLISALNTAGLPLHAYTQTFVNGNVSSTATNNPKTNTTWYSYDIYGRVKWLVQEVEGLGVKTIDYTYDPITGQVTKVDYQRYNSTERFVHKYTYNIAGQLVEVNTSINGQIYELQAKYYYNETGSLKRTELATDLQGIDYVYNLNGQLKAINHPSLQASNDPGHDGTNGFASDVFGFNINYYSGDYTRPSTPTPINATFGNQYNGNIASVDFQTQNLGTPMINTYAYSYNKNNWLTGAEFNKASNTRKDYEVSNITYDPNGNILSLKRNGYSDDGGSNSMDDFTYNYNAETNQLDHIQDNGDNADVNRYNDLKSQLNENYRYNEIGQLTTNIQDQVVYDYNASGLVREVSKHTATNTGVYTTLYQRDYSEGDFVDLNSWHLDRGDANFVTNEEGLVLPVVEALPMPQCDDAVFEYGGLYGTRLQFNFRPYAVILGSPTNNLTASKSFQVVKGAYHTFDLDLIFIQLQRIGETLNTIETGARVQIFEEVGGSEVILAEQVIPPSGTVTYCGDRYDEHINLNFTPSNNRVGLRIQLANTGGVVPYVSPRAGGSIIQTIELDNIHLQVAKEPVVAFEYDDRGHRIKKTTYHNNVGMSPYVSHTYYVRDASGSVMGIYQGHSLRGGQNKLKELPIYGASRLGITYNNESERSRSTNVYQLTDHLGNVRAVIAKDPTSGIVISTATDYYPFGMPMPNRQIIGGEQYRYGYQGEFAETDKETNKPAFQLRIYDPRLGRWLSPDPYNQHFSPYLAMGNNPVIKVDPDGGKDCPPDCGDDWDPSLTGDYDFMNIDNVVLTCHSCKKQSGGGWLDYVQTGLDFAGLIPGFGEIADGANALIYLAKGDYKNAGLSATAMVPFAGWGATGTKLAMKADAALDVKKVLQGRRIKYHKHHLITKNIWKQYKDQLEPVLGKVRDAGENLKKLPTPFHGRHDAYSRYAREQLEDLLENGTFNAQTYKELQKRLSQIINRAYDNYKNTGMNLNEYFKANLHLKQ